MGFTTHVQTSLNNNREYRSQRTFLKHDQHSEDTSPENRNQTNIELRKDSNPFITKPLPFFKRLWDFLK